MKRILLSPDVADAPGAVATPPERDIIGNHMRAKWSVPAPTVDDDAPTPAVKPDTEPAKTGARPATEPPKPAAATSPEPPKPVEEPKWPRNAKEWDAYKKAEKERTESAQKERDSFKEQLESTRKEIEALRKSGPSPELDTLKKERDDLLERIRLIDVEKHPQFQSYFTNKTNAQIDLAKTIVGADKADTAAKILSLPEGEYRDAKVEEFMADLSPIQSSRLAAVLNNLTEINAEKQAELKNASSNWEQLQAKTKAQQEAQAKAYQAEAQSKFDAQVKEAQSSSDFFKTKEGDDAHNKEVEHRISVAKALMFEKAPLEHVARAAMYAAAFPAASKTIEAQAEQIAKLEKQVADLTAAKPSLGSTKPTEEPGGASKPRVQPGMSPMAASAAWMATTTQR